MTTMTYTMNRLHAVPALLGDLSGHLVVTGLAGPAKDVASLTKESDNAFMMAGAMGAAVPMGLGLALAQPERRVIVVAGDGEMLMNIGSLSVVGAMKPENLTIVCINNGHYGETGNQPSHTSLGANIEMIARGSGITQTRIVNQEDELVEAKAFIDQPEGGLRFVLLNVAKGKPAAYSRSLDAVDRKNKFRQALLGHR